MRGPITHRRQILGEKTLPTEQVTLLVVFGPVGLTAGKAPMSFSPCLLWVKSRRRGELRECLLYPQKRTSLTRVDGK